MEDQVTWVQTIDPQGYVWYQIKDRDCAFCLSPKKNQDKKLVQVLKKQFEKYGLKEHQ